MELQIVAGTILKRAVTSCIWISLGQALDANSHQVYELRTDEYQIYRKAQMGFSNALDLGPQFAHEAHK